VKNELKEKLAQYFPVESLNKLSDFIEKYNINLKLTKSRKYKLGDYKPPRKAHCKHRITINGDLNKYIKLLVFIHELGHLIVWEKHKGRVKPHGKEWKEEYAKLINIFNENDIFPIDIKQALINDSDNLKAGILSNPELYRTLKKFDDDNKYTYFLEDLPEKSRFVSQCGKTFIKKERLRKRFRCLCIDNNKTYLFHPLANIKPI